MAVTGYLKEFNIAQQIRTKMYKQLEQGFNTVLMTHKEPEYKYVVACFQLVETSCINDSYVQSNDGRSDSSIHSLLRSYKCS